MKKFFLLKNKLIPFISGGSESLGAAFGFDFTSSISFTSNSGKSTDILFTQIGLGEGPVYRINPNGPQDIEIDDRYIDDLVDFNTNNTRPELFGARYSTGPVNPPSMPSFFSERIVSVYLSSPVLLKSGISANPEIPAPPESKVLFLPTNSDSELASIDSIRFKFNITSLKTQDSSGTAPAQLSIVGLVHSRDETSDFMNYIAAGGLLVNSLVDGGMAAELEVKIPEDKKSISGYRVSVLKITEDIAEDGFSAEVEFLGIDEVRTIPQNYPRTAVAGYVVKSSEFRTGGVANYSTAVKGLIIDVPSNYNQPILESGEVDWRQIEVPPSGDLSYAVNGYRTQKAQKTVLTDTPAAIYEGIWDGTYKQDWTENPVWIVKYLLTDSVNGLGLPESIIDKYNFYNAAQYCDAVDSKTGAFIGVDGFSDGSFRYKPKDYLTDISDALLGLPEGTAVKERRFTCGLVISDTVETLQLIQSICAGFNATLTMRGNKLALVLDRPYQLPDAMFNETNIAEGSFKISGIREEDLITGVEVSYIDFVNHFKRDSIVLDIERPGVYKENRLSVEAVGCTRKSQALRFGKYILESYRSSRRKLQFSTYSTASDLSIGSVISVSQRVNSLNYGYGGIVYSNSAVGSANVVLEHITTPQITSNVFTSNTNPLILKIFKQDTNKIDYYVLNSGYSLTSSSDLVVGNDLIEVSISKKVDITTNEFVSNTAFSSATTPIREDLWALGEIDLNNFYSATSDKLFRIDSITTSREGYTAITASEYNSNALAAAESSISSLISITPKNQSFITPPVPQFSLSYIPAKTNEGVISYNVLISNSTNTNNYKIPVSTVIEYGLVPTIIDVDTQVVI